MTSAVTSFLLFRHGETDWNALERFQGHIDIPLNERGRNQASQLTEPLRAARVEAILSSDLGRAYETARRAADPLELQVFVTRGLREAHLGAAQGLTRREIENHFGEELARRWRSSQVSDADISYPGGETGVEVLARALGALEDFSVRYPFRRVGVATHGGVIRRIMAHLLPTGSPPIPIPNTVIYELAFQAETRRWSLPGGGAPLEKSGALGPSWI